MSLSIFAYDDTYPGLPVRQPFERTIACMSGNFALSGAGRTAAVPAPDAAASPNISEASPRDGAANASSRAQFPAMIAARSTPGG